MLHLRRLVLVLGVGGSALIGSGCVVATTGRSDGGTSIGFLLLPLIFFVIVARMASRSTRAVRSGGRDRARVDGTSVASDAPELTMLRAELSVLADDVLRLEPLVTLNEAARDDYEAGVHRYRVATAALESGRPVDRHRLQRVVDEASWSMSRVRAVIDGRPLPPPPEPLARPGVAGEPAIAVDAADWPVYRDAPMTYRSGWFAGAAPFSGLLLGSVITGMGGWWTIDGPDDPTDEEI